MNNCILSTETKGNLVEKVTKDKELLKQEAQQYKSKADTYNLIIKEVSTIYLNSYLISFQSYGDIFFITQIKFLG